MSDKKPLLLFSGGLDSTFLLLATLYERDCDVLTLSTNILPKGFIAEEAVRKEILFELEDLRSKIKGLHNVRNQYRLEYTFNEKSHGPNDFMYAQVPLWFYAALNIADHHIHSSVGIGYITGDQICYNLHHLKDAWESMWKACKHGEVVPLSFPLIEKFTSKTRIIEYLEKYPLYDKIRSLIHYCEFPIELNGKYHVCDNCESCIRMRPYKYHQDRVQQYRDTTLDYSI